MMDLAWWIGVIGVPLVAAIFAVDWKIHSDSAARSAALHRRVDEGEAKNSAVIKELYEYKVLAATQFATVTALGEIRKDMKDGFGRLEEKLDRLGDRVDKERDGQRR